MQWSKCRTRQIRVINQTNCVPPQASSVASLVALALIAAVVVAALFAIPLS